MAKRRKPGAGRKPKPDRKVLFTIRLLPHVLAELKAQAQTWQGGNGNVSAFTETLIHRSLSERAEEKRDPALKGLLYFIGQIAEWAGGYKMLIHKEELRDRLPTLWRTDKLSFRTFKFAVRGLLDLLEEPPEDPYAREGRIEYLEWRPGERPANEEERRSVLAHIEKEMSPEGLGEDILRTLWLRAVSKKYADRQLEGIRETPGGRRMEREVYGLAQAVRDLGVETLDGKTRGQQQ
jgi:hypothetical protein